VSAHIATALAVQRRTPPQPLHLVSGAESGQYARRAFLCLIERPLHVDNTVPDRARASAFMSGSSAHASVIDTAVIDTAL